MNLNIKYFIYIVFILGTACKSQVQFDSSLDYSSSVQHSTNDQNPTCVIKNINNKNVCVEQKVEIITIKNLEEEHINFLFILDVSASMTDDLSRLGEAFESLISQIRLIKWNMFFTTADHGDHDYTENLETKNKVFSSQKWEDYTGDKPYFGQFMDLEYKGESINQKQLSVNTTDYINVFKDTLTKNLEEDCDLAPYCQGSLEQPLRVLKSSLKRLAKKDPFKGDIISIIVTDEDERSEDLENATKAQEVVNTFNTLFPEKSFHAFSLLIQDNNCLKQQQEYSPQSVYGERISELAKLTQGKNISLCELDYGPPLKSISRFVRNLIESVDLKEQPILTQNITIEFLKGSSRKQWELKNKKIVFKKALDIGSEIKVSYFYEVKNKKLN